MSMMLERAISIDWTTEPAKALQALAVVLEAEGPITTVAVDGFKRGDVFSLRVIYRKAA